MIIIHLDVALTLAVAAIMLAVGEYIKNRVGILSRYFIPTPVIGGIVFSLIALGGYMSDLFMFGIDGTMRDYLLLAFFTTIGFSASFELLKKGGVAVALFLGCALVLVVVQNIVGAFLAKGLGVSPLIGLAAGSISLTGGHGTAAAFGPLLEEAGAIGALPAAIAAATYGLVAGCVIGGPVGSLLIRRHGIKGRAFTADLETADPALGEKTEHIKSDDSILKATMLLVIAIGIGTVLVNALAAVNITIPAYLGPMFVAAIIRNIIDWRQWNMPEREFEVVGNVSLAFFLILALMSMKLWEMAAVAGPLTIILVVQTAIMFAFAYFVTYRVMGRDYDAAVIAAGHCGFGMGATPNAMANMEAFTRVNGPSFKAFFVIPLVGSLFIDFFNAITITSFIGFFS
ncbi:MAG TPA: sodium/glutamate symporter [Salinisphaeraceae bacterium]|nr:sodium/glutamate symporter [Salinisphaeraceae bacterium]